MKFTHLQGPIYAISWRADLIAWANDLGILTAIHITCHFQLRVCIANSSKLFPNTACILLACTFKCISYPESTAHHNAGYLLLGHNNTAVFEQYLNNHEYLRTSKACCCTCSQLFIHELRTSIHAVVLAHSKTGHSKTCCWSLLITKQSAVSQQNMLPSLLIAKQSTV